MVEHLYQFEFSSPCIVIVFYEMLWSKFYTERSSFVAPNGSRPGTPLSSFYKTRFFVLDEWYTLNENAGYDFSKYSGLLTKFSLP